MSMMAPEPIDWDALEASLDTTPPDDVVDVTTIDGKTLLNRERELVEQLEKMGEMFNVHTDEAREIHSQRAAVRIELFRRGLKGN